MLGFKNHQQRAQACRALLSKVGLEANWTDGGPTVEARRQLHDGNQDMSRAQCIVVALAWAIWGEWVPEPISDLFGLDERLSMMAMSLLGAISCGPQGIDEWLGIHGLPQGACLSATVKEGASNGGERRATC